MSKRFGPRLALGLLSLLPFRAVPAVASFHEWQIKEAFSNADGSVQFVEMHDDFAGETLVGGFSLTANSDGSVKTFTFPGPLTHSTPGSMLLATTGFGALPGAVNPDFFLPANFFNPNAASITIQFTGSGDAITFGGASLPKDGVHSLTDENAFGPPGGAQNLVSGINSPTNLLGETGSVNLVPEPCAALVPLVATLRLLRKPRKPI